MVDNNQSGNIVEIKKQKELSDKRLLNMEIVLGIISTIFLFGFIAIGIIFKSVYNSEIWVFFLLFGIGFLQFILCMLYLLRIEQVAGYYECKHCHHKHVPTYKQVFWAMHMCRTRYLKCPKCNQKSWQKKVIKNEE